MTYAEWSQPVRLMEQHIGPATPDQQALADAVGVTLPAGIPGRVAAAMLEDHLLPRIWTDGSRGSTPATDKQIAFLESLETERPMTDRPLTKREASAWIDYYLSARNARRLRELKLAAGQCVTKTETWVNQTTGELHTSATGHVVSSIGASGLVYFKGGNGQCAWPGELSLTDDESATRV